MTNNTLFQDGYHEIAPAIVVNKLTKCYKKFKALDDLSISLPKGKIIGLLGKNGAGKSTLMRCMLGMLKYQGEIAIEDEIVSHRDSSVFENVAFIPDVSGLDDRLTVKQTIDYVSQINPKWNETTANKLMQISSLPLNKKVGHLSKGMKTKLYLLVTLSLDVDILLLDEPTLGLDIAFRKEFFNTILGEFFNEDKTILISTHQVEEIEPLLQEIIFIDQGKIILHADVEELKNSFNVVSVANDLKEELLSHKPKLVTKSLGQISGILPADILIDNAHYSRPQLADLFLAHVGGYNETI
ncbi:MAG: ABC transporter ATP-binding protein [Candidatus Cloacimonadales bacterium]|nr:ABC transporter ATP-binding protein [Candidatus Cloacimonadota bacterium]MDD2650189.1 ABC transporter ATP-binding protein [Candidatus Cloacimonadota bacterium]MDD3501930.1 ABC transporter ATP-binding protein [Candidatus Cloacimonadota bacterium]MDX9976471.1 ABC transporter ATP-binding protein [Candidatus Cloacimonadales bacterium]